MSCFLAQPRDLNGAIWRLSYPTRISLLVQSSFGVFEAALVSYSGTENLTVLSFGLPIMLIFSNFAMGLGIGVNSVTARLVGMGRLGCSSQRTCLLLALASTRRGYFHAQRQVFIGDGAPWIWNLAAMIAPDAIQIVDLYHAKEHLSQLAGAIFGSKSDLSRKWADERHYDLEAGNLDAVLSAFAQLILDNSHTVGVG